MNIVLVDNYDSFTWNLVHAFVRLGIVPRVIRNNEMTVEALWTLKPDAVVISPGPCTPDDAGITLDTIRQAPATLPVLGVCLGHQAIGQVFGGRVVRAALPVHGKTDNIEHQNRGLFAGLPQKFKATRYHSLIVDKATCPSCLLVDAQTPDETIMALRHAQRPVFGVQFHPESIATEYGDALLQHFLNVVKREQPAAALPKIHTRPCLQDSLSPVLGGGTLTRTQTRDIFQDIMSGNRTPVHIAGLLTALAQRGETADELTGAVEAVRSHATFLDAPADAIDIVGTGGDGAHSLNLSTTAALLAAAAGAKVAKHGNRAVSSSSGAANVLEALGYNIECAPGRTQAMLHDNGFGFLFAPLYHTAMRHVAAVRRELGIRTIFNLIGPLANPANVKRLVVGVYAKHWMEPFLKTLIALGVDEAMIVHGTDGLDEISVSAPTHILHYAQGKTTARIISPDMFGMPLQEQGSLRGGDGRHNAERLKRLFSGETGSYHDAAVLNAAGGLMVAGLANDFEEGIFKARTALNDGRAQELLQTVIAASQTP